MTVIKQEVNVGNMATVSTIDMTWSLERYEREYITYKNMLPLHTVINCTVSVAYSGLRAWKWEKVNFSEVVSCDEQSLCIRTAHSVYVSSIGAIWPQTWRVIQTHDTNTVEQDKQETTSLDFSLETFTVSYKCWHLFYTIFGQEYRVKLMLIGR